MFEFWAGMLIGNALSSKSEFKDQRTEKQKREDRKAILFFFKKIIRSVVGVCGLYFIFLLLGLNHYIDVVISIFIDSASKADPLSDYIRIIIVILLNMYIYSFIYVLVRDLLHLLLIRFNFYQKYINYLEIPDREGD